MEKIFFARFYRPAIKGVRRWVCESSGEAGRVFNAEFPLIIDALSGKRLIRINVHKPVRQGFCNRPHTYLKG